MNKQKTVSTITLSGRQISITNIDIFILNRLSLGATQKEIAYEMGIAHGTFKGSYAPHLFQKLGALCAAHAVAIAIRSGIID